MSSVYIVCWIFLQTFQTYFCIQKYSKNVSIYAIFNDQSFNDKLTNDFFNFEQLDPVCPIWSLYFT